MNRHPSSDFADCRYATSTSEVHMRKECMDARVSNSLEKDTWGVFAPRNTKYLSSSRFPPMRYRALYLISPSAFDFIATTNLAVGALAPLRSYSFSMTQNVPLRSRPLTSFVFASCISGDIARVSSFSTTSVTCIDSSLSF